MIKSIYENWLDHLLRVKNHLVTASQEAPVFDVYPDPVKSPQDSLDRITNALAKMQLKSCRSHTLAELLDNLREVASIDDLPFCNTRFIKGHKPSNHIRARIKSHVYTTE